MPIINLASTEQEASERGTSVQRIDCNNDGKVIMWTYETHHGLCISDREHNGYDDSDWYMLVWNEEKQEPQEICFASTRGWTYPCYGSRPDASPETMAKYTAWCEVRDRAAAIQKDIAQSKRVDAGKAVRVIAGRKVKKGSILIVHHTEQSAYGKSKYGTWGEYGQIAYCHPTTPEGRKDMSQALIIVDCKNLEVVEPEQYLRNSLAPILALRELACA